jgi:peptidoglycan/xylan/chitin deacetylase (PgdA/CDA1 family)
MAAGQRPLVLAYHAVSSAWRSPLAVTEWTLRDQLQHLARRGYIGLTFGEAERLRRCGGLPERSLVVTFDDGWSSTLRAKPILDELGFPGTVFVVTRFVDSGAPLSWFGIDNGRDEDTHGEYLPLQWDDLRRLHATGWEIGSHTVTHPLLTTLDGDALAAELTGSRSRICEQLGSCDSLAYPYGVADERVALAARAAGFAGACVLTGAHVSDTPYLRPRVGLSEADAGTRLALKVSRGGLALRRSPVARAIRRARGRRSWQPPAQGD